MYDAIRMPLEQLEYFALLTTDEKHLPLAEAAASIARIEYPGLLLGSVEDELDQMVWRLRQKVSPNASAIQKIWMINQFLYEDLKFRGIADVEESPDFSCINMVLKNRLGSECVLATIYLELASALNLQCRGIIFPERFFVKIRFKRNNNVAAEVIIDPATGQSLTMDHIHALLAPYKQSHGLTDEFDIPGELFLEPATKKEMLVAMLGNLRDAYFEQEDWTHLIKTLDFLITLYPQHIENYRERGYALIKKGLHHKAMHDLEYYLQHVQPQFAHDADIVSRQLELLRNTH